MAESDEGTTSLSKVSVKPVVLVRVRGRLTRGELIPSGPPEVAILQFYSPQLCINLVLVKKKNSAAPASKKPLVSVSHMSRLNCKQRNILPLIDFLVVFSFKCWQSAAFWHTLQLGRQSQP
jgi:hypothetical protein